MSYLFFSEPKNKSRAARRAIKPTIIGLQLKTSLSGSSVPESPCAIAHPVAGAVSCYSTAAERSFDLHPEADHRRRHAPQGYWASQRYPELPCRYASNIWKSTASALTRPAARLSSAPSHRQNAYRPQHRREHFPEQQQPPPPPPPLFLCSPERPAAEW